MQVLDEFSFMAVAMNDDGSPAPAHGTVTGAAAFWSADVLTDVEHGLSWDSILQRWGGGQISREAVSEAVRLARHALLDENERLAALPAAA